MALASLLLLGVMTLNPHVRSITPDLRALIDEGGQRSTAIRSRLARLDRSDLVVYVDYNYFPQAGIAGFVTFMGTSGGWRFIRVSLRWDMSRLHQLAILGHEMQHSVEIAEAPEVVDAESMAQLYVRIGSGHATAGCRSFDTSAAVDVESQVRRELRAVSVADQRRWSW